MKAFDVWVNSNNHISLQWFKIRQPLLFSPYPAVSQKKMSFVKVVFNRYSYLCALFFFECGAGEKKLLSQKHFYWHYYAFRNRRKKPSCITSTEGWAEICYHPEGNESISILLVSKEHVQSILCWWLGCTKLVCRIIFHACLKAFVPSVRWPHNPCLCFDFCWSSTHNAFIEKLCDRKVCIPKARKTQEIIILKIIVFKLIL